jgi:hypothetical protein
MRKLNNRWNSGRSWIVAINGLSELFGRGQPFSGRSGLPIDAILSFRRGAAEKSNGCFSSL